MDPRIVVVVPAFNEEAYVVRCLRALTSQTLARELYEVVLVNNASTDRTADLARMFGVTVIDEPSKGSTLAIKRGIDYAIERKAEWVCMTDADGEVAPDWLEVVERRTREKGLVGITGRVGFYDAGFLGNFVADFGYQAFIWLISRPLGGFVQFTAQNCAFSVAAYNQVGGFDLRFLISPDVLLSKKLSKVGRVRFAQDMRVMVSARRFREGWLKALVIYGRGFWRVVREKPGKIELDDVR